MYRRILIPLDGSLTAEQVVPYARALSRALKLSVELLVVIDLGAILTSSEKVRYFDTLAAEQSRRSKEYLGKIASRFSGRRIKRSVESGQAADVIIEKAAADKSTLIAMTTHGRSGLGRWLLGSVAEKVLRASANPLLLIRAAANRRTEGEATFKSIVAPLDGSQLAESVLPTVSEFAKKLDLDVLLFRSYTSPYGAFASGSGVYAVNLDELLAGIRDEARSYLEEKMEELAKQGAEEVSYVLEEDGAADKIVSLANHNPESLIVMGSHGRSGVSRWALGSVTETVVRHSSSPVLVMRGNQSE